MFGRSYRTYCLVIKIFMDYFEGKRPIISCEL